jgi:hypothetical protein
MKSFWSSNCKTPPQRLAHHGQSQLSRSSTAKSSHRSTPRAPSKPSSALSYRYNLNQRKLACVVDIEHDKYLMYLFARLLLVWFMGHHLVKLIELDLTTAIGIQLSNHLIYSCGFGLDS